MALQVQQEDFSTDSSEIAGLFSRSTVASVRHLNLTTYSYWTFRSGLKRRPTKETVNSFQSTYSRTCHLFSGVAPGRAACSTASGTKETVNPVQSTCMPSLWLRQGLMCSCADSTSRRAGPFSDVFEEGGVPGKNTPFHGGFGMINLWVRTPQSMQQM